MALRTRETGAVRTRTDPYGRARPRSSSGRRLRAAVERRRERDAVLAWRERLRRDTALLPSRFNVREVARERFADVGRARMVRFSGPTHLLWTIARPAGESVMIGAAAIEAAAERRLLAERAVA